MKKILFALFLCTVLHGPSVFALNENSKNSIDNNAPFYVPGLGGPNLGAGGCYGLGIPNIVDEAGLAQTINDHIQRVAPSSPFVGLGQNFVNGAKSAQINPLLAVAQLQYESSLATASDGWHKTSPPSYNGFGRSATESQPNSLYNGTRRVYRWNSWQDSLEGTDSWYVYINRRYIEQEGIPPNDFDAYVAKYAPSSDGNDEGAYQNVVKSIINQLVTAAGSAVRCDGAASDAVDANGNKIANVELGRGLATEKGWVDGEWSCLLNLWTMESHWHERAINDAEKNNDLNANRILDESETMSNTEDDAYGIPQSKPGGKMATVGSDWLTNPTTQITWGFSYIEASYSTPCGAWQHFQNQGSY